MGVKRNEKRLVLLVHFVPTPPFKYRQLATNYHPEMRVILLHSSGSPKLANRIKFPYSLGILGSTQPLVDLLLILSYAQKRLAEHFSSV